MKVAISIPDDVFDKAEIAARRRNMSRSALYAKALEELISREEVSLTEQINAALADLTDEDVREQDAWLRAGQETVLKHTEW